MSLLEAIAQEIEETYKSLCSPEGITNRECHTASLGSLCSVVVKSSLALDDLFWITDQITEIIDKHRPQENLKIPEILPKVLDSLNARKETFSSQ